ncbi:glycosyltransferase family 4 protein [Flavobacteriaceae bacterium F08102]|nr:glycosyltransferase family 4 protein [Flavobacteriaceae bacterium F08102]
MKKVLIIGQIIPEPTSTAMGRRMLQLIKLFQSAGAEVTFACGAEPTAYAVDLSALGVAKMDFPLNDSSVDAALVGLAPDVVIFDRFVAEEQYGWRVAAQCPSAIRILDTEDFHSLRLGRQAAFKRGKAFKPSDLLTLDIAKREIASLYRCDLTLFISSVEIGLLQDVFKIDRALLQYLPFLEPQLASNHLETCMGFEQREDFISLGNFAHEPNWQSVVQLKKEIWPLIRAQLPNAKLNVYGAYPSEKVRQLHSEKDGFIIKGRAENAHEVLSKARVLIAPLAFGAGLKGKFIDAMQVGTPSVTTSIGAEGMSGNLPWHGYVTDNPQDFADKAVVLHNEKVLFEQAQRNGVKLINQLFTLSEATPFIEKINAIREDLAAHRAQNFIGSMLMHHRLQSTKYLSKWIEEKNMGK